ncbi:hypothetical protein HanPI659440_Chr08g0304621 [Helianthus annuus]|nr:hypothetical protein HanPI659440_Chr08g0304621 [Helianthus annuus]
MNSSLSLSASILHIPDRPCTKSLIAVVYAKKKIGYREELMEVGRIEVIMNSLNPMWIQKINLAFHFEIVQPLMLDLKEQDYVGEANCVLSEAAFKGGSGGGYSRTGVKDEARRRYARRLRQELEEEMERVERIRRMQSVFNREKIKHRRGYERWRDDSYWEYHQHFQRDDWYWKPIQVMGIGVITRALLTPLQIILCLITMPYWVSPGRYIFPVETLIYMLLVLLG